MKLLRYLTFCLSCFLNWLVVSAYRPIANLITKRVTENSGVIIRALSGLFKGMLSPAPVKSGETSLKMMAQNFTAKRREIQVKFDTTAFLSWWFAGATSGQSRIDIDTQNAMPGADEIKQSAKDINRQEFAERMRRMPLTRREKTFVITGYMDYDPKIAASRKHTMGGRGSTISPSTSWFNL